MSSDLPKVDRGRLEGRGGPIQRDSVRGHDLSIYLSRLKALARPELVYCTVRRHQGKAVRRMRGRCASPPSPSPALPGGHWDDHTWPSLLAPPGRMGYGGLVGRLALPSCPSFVVLQKNHQRSCLFVYILADWRCWLTSKTDRQTGRRLLCIAMPAVSSFHHKPAALPCLGVITRMKYRHKAIIDPQVLQETSQLTSALPTQDNHKPLPFHTMGSLSSSPAPRGGYTISSPPPPHTPHHT